jgi:hypothetical protein
MEEIMKTNQSISQTTGMAPLFLRKQFVSRGNQLLQESTSHVMRAQSFLGLPAYKRRSASLKLQPSKLLLGKVSTIDQNSTETRHPASIPSSKMIQAPGIILFSLMSAPSCHQLPRHLGSDHLSDLLQRTPARTAIAQYCKKERSLKTIARGEEIKELLKTQSFLLSHKVQVIAPNRIHITFIFSCPSFDRKFSSKSCTQQGPL